MAFNNGKKVSAEAWAVIDQDGNIAYTVGTNKQAPKFMVYNSKPIASRQVHNAPVVEGREYSVQQIYDNSEGSLNQIDNANSAEYQLSIMQNIEREIPKAVRKRTQNWSLVKTYLLQQTSKGGSTSCYRHCRFLGVDPGGFSFYDEKN